jgi:hypothetical protein
LDDEEFKIEVIERLARIETKQDITNGTVKKNCTDIDGLKVQDIKREAQWSLMKKLSACVVTSIGVVITILTIILR